MTTGLKSIIADLRKIHFLAPAEAQGNISTSIMYQYQLQCHVEAMRAGCSTSKDHFDDGNIELIS